LLDLYFSSLLFQIGFFLLLTIIIATLFYVHPVCDTVDSFLKRFNLFRLRRIILVFAYMLMFSPMILPILNTSYWGYGPVKSFNEAGIVDTYLYAIDEKSLGGGKVGLPSHYLRLHLIDLNDGRCLFRHMIGSTGISRYSGPLVFCAPGEKRLLVRLNDAITAFEIPTGHNDYRISRDTLPHLVNSFKKDVVTYTFCGRSSIIDALTADGYHILVNPFTLKVLSSIPEKYADPGALRLRTFQDTGSPFILSQGPRKMLLNAQYGTPVNNSEVFIEGSILQVIPRSRMVIIASYTDMYKQSLLLTGISPEGKKLWRKGQEAFTSAESSAIDFSAIYNNDLILMIGGNISSINVKTGHVSWQKKY
jgi:hypothetical protein